MRFAKLIPTLGVVGIFAMACGGGGTSSNSPTATIPSSLSVSSFDVSFSAMATLKDLHAAGSGLVGVLLPDTTSSTRWVNSDLPYLTKVFKLNGGEDTDPNAIDFAKGYNQVVWGDAVPQETVGKTANGATLVGDQVAPGWDNAKGQQIFQQQYTAHPEINATIEANDGLANAVVTVLKQKGVPANKVPTVGQDASRGGS